MENVNPYCFAQVQIAFIDRWYTDLEQVVWCQPVPAATCNLPQQKDLES